MEILAGNTKTLLSISGWCVQRQAVGSECGRWHACWSVLPFAPAGLPTPPTPCSPPSCKRPFCADSSQLVAELALKSTMLGERQGLGGCSMADGRHGRIRLLHSGCIVPSSGAATPRPPRPTHSLPCQPPCPAAQARAAPPRSATAPRWRRQRSSCETCCTRPWTPRRAMRRMPQVGAGRWLCGEPSLLGRVGWGGWPSAAQHAPAAQDKCTEHHTSPATPLLAVAPVRRLLARDDKEKGNGNKGGNDMAATNTNGKGSSGSNSTSASNSTTSDAPGSKQKLNRWVRWGGVGGLLLCKGAWAVLPTPCPCMPRPAHPSLTTCVHPAPCRRRRSSPPRTSCPPN